MSYYESNFEYIKKTNFSKYYDGLIIAECASENYKIFSKIILRRIIESFIKDIAFDLRIDSKMSTRKLLRRIKDGKEIKLPDYIYDHIQIIRINGIGITLYRSRDKNMDKHPIELLKLMHEIFIWYLKETDSSVINESSELSFRAPGTLTNEESELKKLKDDIFLKNTQIYNLREKILDLGTKSRDISALSNIIIEIKKQVAPLEILRDELEKYIKLQRNKLNFIKEHYEDEVNRIYEVQKKCRENHKLLSQKESALVRAELDNQQLKQIEKELYEKDRSTDARVRFVEGSLETLRKKYNKLLELTNDYQDAIESIEFSDDYELIKKLKNEIALIKSEISVEDKNFYNEVSIYNKEAEETKKRVMVQKRIADENIRKKVKYNDFYLSFLRLHGRQLKILFSFVETAISFKRNSSNDFLSKSKEWFFKYSGMDKSFSEEFNKNMQKLKNISDEQLKLILYYKMNELCILKPKTICSKKNFIETLDKFVETAFNMLMNKEDFKFIIGKTHSIKIYYLRKLIEGLKSRYKNIKLSDDLIEIIYSDVLELSRIDEFLMYEKVNVSTMKENVLRNSIRKNPFEFLLIMADVGDNEKYIDMYKIILEILKQSNSESKTSDLSKLVLSNFLSGSFRIFILESDSKININDDDELLPFLVSEILIGNIKDEDAYENIESYELMVDTWKKNQLKYNDLSIGKNEENKNFIALQEKKIQAERELKQAVQYKNDINYLYEDRRYKGTESRELQNKLKEAEINVHNMNKILNGIENDINDVKIKIDEYDKKIIKMKNLYPDMHSDI